MNLNHIVFSIFNGLLSIYIICFFFGTFAPKNDFKSRNILLMLLSFAFVISLIINASKVVNFVILSSLVLILSFFYDTKWHNRFFLSIASVLLSSFSELVVAILSSYILKVDFPTLKTGYYFLIGMLLSKLITFITIAIIRLGNHSLPFKRLEGVWAYILLLPLTSIIFVFMISDYMYTIVDDKVKQTLTIASVFLIIITNILLFYVIDKIRDYFVSQSNLAIANELIENQKITYKNLFDSQTEIKKIKHDLKNVMYGILHEIDTNNIEKAKNYIKHNCNLLAPSTISFISGNSIIDTLISAKNQVANDLNITLDVETELSTQIYMDSIDFSVLIGNAIDNAIEATQSVKTHDKVINITIMTKNSNLLIIVKNPVDAKIDTQNLVTTKKEFELHGFGVLQMTNLVEKYGGDIFFKCDNKQFKTTIILNNKANE